MFFDIDGVLTSSAEYIPNESPKITKDSIKILKKCKEKGFILVFITARSVRELRLKPSFEKLLQKNGLLKDSLIYGALGLDEASHSYEFKTKNGEIVFEKGNAKIVKKQIVKRETFSNIDQYLLYKMLVGKEIKQQLKYKGYKIKSANPDEIINDARIGFELEKNDPKVRKKMVEDLKEIVKEQRKIFKTTKKFGCPVDLNVRDIETGVSIEPKELGKHLGVLRALNKLGIEKREKIIGYAFGDSEHDSMMKIRKDIQFIKIKNNKDLLKKIKEILEKQK